MRLIDADALLEALNRKQVPYRADVNAEIMNAPTSDAEPVRRGHWNYENHNYSCSVCGSKRSDDNLEIFMGDYKYCPICGSWNGYIVMVAHLEKEEAEE